MAMGRVLGMPLIGCMSVVWCVMGAVHVQCVCVVAASVACVVCVVCVVRAVRAVRSVPA